MTKSLTMAQAKASLSEFASRAAAGERFLLVRRGRPLAALVATRDLAWLESGEATVTFLGALSRFRRRRRRELTDRPLRVARSGPRPVA